LYYLGEEGYQETLEEKYVNILMVRFGKARTISIQ
jgi:hypothetical protein